MFKRKLFAVLMKNIFKNLFVVIVVVVALHTVVSQNDLENGSGCMTPNNECGRCIPIIFCEPIFSQIQTRNQSAFVFARESHCGFDGNIPLVCCYEKPSVDPLEEFIVNLNRAAPKNDFDKEKQKLEAAIVNDFHIKTLPDRSVCGLEKDDFRIWGGREAELNEFPWMALLEYVWKKDGSIADSRCGGSLINNRYVLTAAHCLLQREFLLTNVKLGDWNLTSDPDCRKFGKYTECAEPVINVGIDRSLPHPLYSRRTSDNDVGLIRLARDVAYTDYIRPICLPPDNFPPPPYSTLLTVAGWGVTENETLSDIKLKVEVPLFENQQCSEKLNRYTTLNQLCAGGEIGRDSCQGDSGGPLMRTYEDQVTKQKQWYLEGVVSLGVGCGHLSYPAIYTRVSRYTNWIINNLA